MSKASNLASIAEDVIKLLYSKKSAFKNALYTTATKKKLTSSETKQLFAICAEISKKRGVLFKMDKHLMENYCGMEDRKTLAEFDTAVRHVYLFELVVAKTTRKPKQHVVAKIIMKHRAALKEKFGSMLESDQASKAKKTSSQDSKDDEPSQVFRYARIKQSVQI